MADDDEIVAGEQKMSLKCPVRPIRADKVNRFHFVVHAAKLCPDQTPCTVEEMRPPPMFRCNLVVQHDGTDDNMALPYLREGAGT